MSLEATLATMVETTDDAVDTKSGFDHIHTASYQRLGDIAEAFRANGYVLEMLTCEDRRANDDSMRLVYTFNRFTDHERHCVTSALPLNTHAPSLAGIYKAADWFEREVFDMYGVRFDDHPDLKRILLPDDADFHALLKDFGRIEDAAEPSTGADGDGA